LGITTLVTLHDLNLAAAYCSRLYLLADGHIATSGAPEEVLTPAWIRAVYEVDAVSAPHPVTGKLHLVFTALADNLVST